MIESGRGRLITVHSTVSTYASKELHADDRDIEGLYAALCEAVPGIDQDRKSVV